MDVHVYGRVVILLLTDVMKIAQALARLIHM
jgi:hypothetical protein